MRVSHSTVTVPTELSGLSIAAGLEAVPAGLRLLQRPGWDGGGLVLDMGGGHSDRNTFGNY